MSHLDALEPNNLRPVLNGVTRARQIVADLREDLSFARALWHAFGPPRDRVPARRDALFGDVHYVAMPSLVDKRIAVVSSGGSGATSALIGVRRAFEEADLTPVMLSACSGSVLFATLWACGLSADDMARFWLDLPASAYVDPRWRTLAHGALHRFRGTTGLLGGEAIEATFRKRFGSRTLGETAIPLAVVVWNIDHNRVEYLSSHRTPHIELAQLAHVAVAIPIMVEPVQIGSTWYGDGGIVDIFPVAPLTDVEPIDLVIGTNSYFPADFDGELLGDWYDAPWSIVRASAQLRYSACLQLAREHVDRLGDRLELLHPVPYERVRGAQFYESFLDRSAWPEYIRAGRTAAREALLRRDRAYAAAAVAAIGGAA